jgi:hypothetical protein
MGRHIKLMTAVLLGCGASAAATWAATMSSPIADVVDVVNEAFQTPPEGAEIAAQIGDKLLPNALIRTATDSAIEMNFPDGAVLRLEAESELVLDSYVYDPGTSTSTASINVQDGLVRYSTDETAEIDDQGVAFVTPVATVGIRGTDVVISVGQDGGTIIDVLSGRVVGQPKEHETSVEAEEGQSIRISKADAPPEVGAIGDFATAAGTAPSEAPSNTDTTGDDARDRSRESTSSPPGNAGGGPGPSGNSGGGGEGGGGGGEGGGGNSGGADGDGNAGHGDNGNGRDPDNPGKGKGKDKD